MPLVVVGAGFGRTGTLSLKLALERLGFGPCHHTKEVLEHPEQRRHWQDAAAGRAVDWEEVFAGYRSAVDWPSAHFWRELAAAYPRARVILTVRPEAAWWASFSTTILPLIECRAEIADPHLRDVVALGTTLIAERTMGGRPDDKATALACYRRRSAEVAAAVAPERLLVFDVAEGWAPLCAFLGWPVPDTPFPRTNPAEEFWRPARGVGPAAAAASR
jgi:hypothetical protein